MVDAISTVWAKKEATAATDALPTGADNGILTRNFSMKPLEQDRVDRNLDQLIYGAQSSKGSNQRMTMSYEVELAGAGVAGTAPRWMELLEACGMAVPTLDAGVSAEQRFAAPGVPASSLTQYAWWQDQIRRMVGSVGTFSMDYTAGSLPFLSFTWLGLLHDIPFAKQAVGETDLGDWQEPIEVNVDHTTFTLDDYAVPMSYLRLDAGVNTGIRNLVNKRYARRGNHAMTGTVMVEATDIAVRDYLATLKNGPTVPMALEHGLDAGNIIGNGWEKVQITDITESVEDDILMWAMAITCTVDGGAADWVVTAK